MRRLSGLDAGFLYMETPTLHMHTLKISIVDPATVPGGYSFEKVTQVLSDRLHLLPMFRRRICEVPFGLHHPLWVEDGSFDIANHVRRMTAPPPGGVRQLADVCSDVASRPLDRSRPLWELWVVEGLEDGHVGFVAKIHHCVADGIAAAEMLAGIMLTDPDAADEPVAPPARPWKGEFVPRRSVLLLDALRARLFGLLNIPGLLRRTVRGLRAAARRRKAAAVSPPAPFDAPNTLFNGALSANRLFVMTTMALDDVKAVKTALGVTVNDVVLAVTAGALRRYLSRHDALPDKALVAGVPVSTRQGASEEDEIRANSVSNMFTALRTDIADPVERIRAISDVTKIAKEVHQALGADMLADWSELTPPRPFAAWMRTYSRFRLAERHRPPINLVVSNVPGPSVPLHIAGARLVSLYSMGPILEGIGLNVTVWSYLDQLNWGVVSTPEAMPDLWDFTTDLHDALDELRKAAA
ncbi:MAG TPA: wax ester/triacylglycerol synthase family O-acyltransferase [Acidimicrobiales bacterium]|nr:wax ester/triacylglycerol synthase family O-acyltransferase [Acidimicrobiales bacterium]